MSKQMHKSLVGSVFGLSVLLAASVASAEQTSTQNLGGQIPSAEPESSAVLRSPHAVGWGVGLSTVGLSTGILGAVVLVDVNETTCKRGGFSTIDCGIGRWTGGLMLAGGALHLAVGVPLVIYGAGEPDEPQIALHAGPGSAMLDVAF